MLRHIVLGLLIIQLFGLKNTTLVDISSNNEYQIPLVGVAKLLFQSTPTKDNITKDDVDEYKAFLNHYNFGITQDSKRKIINKFYPSNSLFLRKKFLRLQQDAVYEIRNPLLFSSHRILIN